MASRDCEDGRATGKPQGVGSEAYLDRYVAGSDTRGPSEGRPYLQSQQSIREICGFKEKVDGVNIHS